MARNLYIKVSDEKNLENVLTTLFQHGFVFNESYRIKTFGSFIKKYPDDVSTGFECWNYIGLGRDKHCKMVFDGWRSVPNNAIRIRLDEFLKELNDW